MTLPNEPDRGDRMRFFTLAAVGLLIVAALATAASWHLYPMFIDTYYHMAVIEGFSQAGGISTWAFWEMAPAGRVHIYPPSLHVIGYFFELLGVSPGTFMTFVSGTCYALCLLTTWLWLRRILGERSAFFALVFLSGPSAFVWTQATFQAVAGVLVLAPLALLALETEHFLACGVLNFVASTMHPMGLFLPPALVLNTLLRRKKILAGLLAASVPVVLYGPWLAHIWANRAFLPENRTGGEISLGGVGGGANLGLFLAGAALLAIPSLIARRGPALGLIGPLLGFAVVFPMGFGSRFLSFNIHWPLAGLAGYGMGELVRWMGGGFACPWWERHFGTGLGRMARWLEQRVSLRPAADLLSVVVVGVALLVYPAFMLPLGGPGPGGRGGPGGPGGPPGTRNVKDQVRRMFSEARFTVQTSALPKLFEAYSGEGGGIGMGMAPGGPGPGGGPGMGPGGGPGMGPNRQGMGMRSGQQRRPNQQRSDGSRQGTGPDDPGVAFGGPGGGPGMGFGGPAGPGMAFGGPGMGPGGGPGMTAQGQRSASGTASGTRSQMPWGRQGGQRFGGMGPGGMGPGGMGGENVLRRADAEEFFEAVRTNVEPGDIIQIDEGATGNLIAGATGRWTTSGILRDVRSENGRVRAEACDFAAVVGGGMGMPGPGGRMGSRTPPTNFKKVFENDYGALYQNPTKVEHPREPRAADVNLPCLVVIAGVGFLLVLIDLWVRRAYVRPIAGLVGTIAVALCLVPLATTAIGELRNPPSVSSQSWPGGPGGPPGAGPGGPPGGGPGFGPPGSEQGLFLPQVLLREADADKNDAVSREEFLGLADRWFKSWDADRNGNLSLDEAAQGLQSLLGPPPGMEGPMPGPDGLPGFGPGRFLARPIFSACDANADSKLTRDEMVGQFDCWFREWDEGAKGSLNAAALARGLESILGPPPMF